MRRRADSFKRRLIVTRTAGRYANCPLERALILRDSAHFLLIVETFRLRYRAWRRNCDNRKGITENSVAMCGIAGFVLAEGNAALATIQAMCDVIRHRGPDDEGFRVNGRCAIGMRRLSIIDLSTGHQPISNEDGSVWVVFNGEIYNFQELRETLLGQGHRFTTNSDTETLVHLYEQEGVEGLPKLRGMFGYAIWDQRRQQLLLVRDRFGKKPLYYTQVAPGQAAPAGLYFGSELKCL